MYPRIDRRQPTRRNRRCQCGAHLAQASYVALVESARTPKGPRQSLRLRLPSYRNCCIQDRDEQARFWGEVSIRLDEVAERGSPGRRKIVLAIAKAVSRDLDGAVGFEQQAVVEGRQKLLARWEGDGGEWARYLAPPDVSRLKAFPEELSGLADARAAEEVCRSVLAASPFSEDEGWEYEVRRHRDRASEVSGSLKDEVQKLLGSGYESASRRARALLRSARQLSQDFLDERPSHISRSALRTARKKVREFLQHLPPDSRRQRRSRAFFMGRRSAASALPDSLRELVQAQPAERLLAVSQYLEGKTQLEVGLLLFSELKAGSAQRSVARHLLSFQRQVREALPEPSSVANAEPGGDRRGERASRDPAQGPWLNLPSKQHEELDPDTRGGIHG